ncbi:hypothetical protein G9A89_005701 [Geosiphon pyriformis]|nr:hypothetical protein G9A89_005701 [Geosiphon pyriformis]
MENKGISIIDAREPDKMKGEFSKYIPSEIFRGIFKLIDDVPTLFSCLFVNHQWCHEIIQIFWLSPFNKSPSPEIIKFYAASLSELSQKALLDEEFFPLFDIKKTTFVYPSFLRNLHFGAVQSSIIALLFPNKIMLTKDQRIKVSIALREIISLIFQTSEALNELIFEVFAAQVGEFPEENLLFTEFPGSQNALEPIKKFHFRGDYYNPNFWPSLTRRCQQITHFGFDKASMSVHEDEQEDIANFIRAQKRLSHLQLYNCDKLLSTMIAALSSCSRSLRTLSFNKMDFTSMDAEGIKGLKSCVNLEALDLDYCSNCDTAALVEAAESFHQLRYFSYLSTRRTIPVELVKTILIASNNHLEFFSLNPLSWTTFLDPLISETFHTNTQSVKFLELPRLSYEQVSQILTACPNLKDFIFSATLDFPCLETIEKAAPESLQHLRININGVQRFTLPALRSFFKSGRINLKSFHIGAPFNERTRDCVKEHGIADVYPMKRIEYYRRNYIPDFGIKDLRYTRIPDEFFGR